jgi:hypothetical protein
VAKKIEATLRGTIPKEIKAHRLSLYLEIIYVSMWYGKTNILFSNSQAM